MLDQCVVIGLFKRGQAQQHRVIAQFLGQRGLCHRLRRRPHSPSDTHAARRRLILHDLRGQFQHRPEQPHVLVADLELRGVHTDGQPARTSRQIITAQRTLPPFVELAVFVEGKRVRRNNQPPSQRVAPIAQDSVSGRLPAISRKASALTSSSIFHSFTSPPNFLITFSLNA